MERNVSTLSIVLHSRRYGQLHRRLRMLTVDFGLIDVISYGARKSVKAPHAEVFADGQAFLYYNPVAHDYTLKDFRPLASHEGLHEDLGATYTALFFCEMILKTHGGDGAATYDLLGKALDLLEDERSFAGRILIQFVWRLLSICGLQADLERCPLCSRVYREDESLSFNVQLSAPCCADCATLDADMPLPPGARRYLRVTADMDFADAVRVDLHERTCRRIKDYMVRYAAILAGTRLKTLEGGIIQTLL